MSKPVNYTGRVFLKALEGIRTHKGTTEDRILHLEVILETLHSECHAIEKRFNHHKHRIGGYVDR